MKIKMKIAVAGTFHGLANGVKIGDVVTVDDQIGARYCQLHYAEPVAERKEERAVKNPEVEVRREPDPAPVAEPEPVAEAEATETEDTPRPAPRPGPRRPR